LNRMSLLRFTLSVVEMQAGIHIFLIREVSTEKLVVLWLLFGRIKVVF